MQKINCNFALRKILHPIQIMSDALNILRRFGIRPSHQRLAVLEYLIQHRNHPSADKIYEDLHAEMPMISRTTVFNTLRLFNDAGVVHTLSIGTDPVAFDADLSPHAHLYCRECHTLIDIPVEEADWHRMLIYAGPQDCRMQVLFHGLCPACRRHD